MSATFDTLATEARLWRAMMLQAFAIVGAVAALVKLLP